MVDWHLVESQIPLAQYLQRKGDRVRQVKPREYGDVFRGSSIGYMCPRKEVLKHIHQVWEDDVIEPDLDFIFTIGHGIHEAIQQNLLYSILVGSWICLGCGSVYGSMERPIPRPDRCESNVWDRHTDTLKVCPNHNYVEDVILDWHLPGFMYKEIDLHMSEPIKLYSHPDGIVWRGEGSPPDDLTMDNEYLELLEIKSAAWTAMLYGYGHGAIEAAPIPFHRDQSLLYQYVLGIPRGRILYVDKSGRGLGSSFTEHIVTLDEEYVEEHVIGRYLSVDEGIKHRNPELAPRVCPKANCAKARGCPVRKPCWDL